MPLPEGVRVPDPRVNVLLPVGYDDHPGLAYPVVYLLHGAGDTYSSWADKTAVEEVAAPFPIVVAMPDGGHQATATWYADWVDGTWQAETYLTEVLPQYLADHYRLLPGREAVAGLSMGGFGAMSLAARYPGRYVGAASFSGVLDTMWGAPGTGDLFAEMNEEFGTPTPRVWGPQAEGGWRRSNPTDLASALDGVVLMVAAGEGKRGGFAGDDDEDANGYGMEEAIREMNLSFLAALEAAGIAVQADLYDGGYHGWPYWDAGIRWALPQLAAILGPPQPVTGEM